MTQAKPITETPTSRAAKQKRAGASRARRWREAKKERREPLPRDADQAIAEALAFLIARHKRDGVNIKGGRVAAVDPADIAVMSLIILEREGFAPLPAGKMVKARLAPRDEFDWPDHMPSLRPGPIEHMRQAKGEDGWTTPMHQLYAVMNGRSPSLAQ